MFKIYEMARRLKQKVLFSQIFEFLGQSKFNAHWSISRYTRREYLLELTCHTSAKEVRFIKYEDLKSFTDHLFRTESSEWEREYAAKIVRNFYRYCISKGYVAEMPWRPLKEITNDEKEAFIKTFTANKKPSRTPNMNMVMRVGELKEQLNKRGTPNTLREITAILTKEIGRKQHLSSICKWYNVYKKQKKVM